MPTLHNVRYERFAQAIVDGLNARDAYKEAGFAPNDGNCIRLKQRPEVQARIAELIEMAADRVVVDKARVIAELAKIGFADFRKLHTATGALKRIEDIDDETAGAIAGIEVVTRRLPGGDEGEVEHVAKIKMWDKPSALVNLGKHLGMFTEKVEHSGPNGGPIATTDPTNIELARLIAFTLTKASREQADG